MKLNEDFVLSFYRDLKEKGYQLYKGYTTYAGRIFACQKGQEKELKQGWFDNFSHEKIHNEALLLEFVKNYNIHHINLTNEKEQNVPLDFFIDYYQHTSSENQLQMFKLFEKFTGVNFNTDSLTYVLDRISNNSKEILTNLSKIPVSVLDIFTISVDDIHNYLKTKNIEAEDLDKFYVKYFKARKNQIKYPHTGPKVKDFLLNLYGRDEEKLSPYFPFFNHIKQEFDEIPWEVDEMKSPYVVAIRINCRKASQILCIPNFHETQIENEIQSFLYGFKSYKNLDEISMEDVDKNKKIVEFRCYSQEPINQAELNNLIKDYLYFKRDNLAVETNRSNVAKWLMERDLRVQLSENANITTTKKLKI